MLFTLFGPARGGVEGLSPCPDHCFYPWLILIKGALLLCVAAVLFWIAN